jgi:maltose-binding protein MalE
MLRKFLVFALCSILLLGINGGCGDDDILISLTGILRILAGIAGQSSDQSPALSMIETSEQAAVEEIAREFRDYRDDEIKVVRIITSDDPVKDFIEVVLPEIAEDYRVDFLILQSKELDPLITAGWIQPYPGKIDRSDFMSVAIRAMTRDGKLYGIPIFMDKEGQVKGIVVSSETEGEPLNWTLDFSYTISTAENCEQIAVAAGGKSVHLPEEEEMGQLAGVLHGGDQENQILSEIVKSFEGMGKVQKVSFAYSPEPLTYIDDGYDFMDTMEDALEDYGSLDFLIISDEDIEDLMDEGVLKEWIQPYPEGFVVEAEFLPVAIRAMKHDDQIYGLPIFVKDGLVIGVALGSTTDEKYLAVTLEFIDFLTLRENAAKFAEALGGTPARERVEIVEVNFGDSGDDLEDLNE